MGNSSSYSGSIGPMFRGGPIGCIMPPPPGPPLFILPYIPPMASSWLTFPVKKRVQKISNRPSHGYGTHASSLRTHGWSPPTLPKAPSSCTSRQCGSPSMCCGRYGCWCGPAPYGCWCGPAAPCVALPGAGWLGNRRGRCGRNTSHRARPGRPGVVQEAHT